MKHPEIDFSLRAAEPPLESLADGFSPPAEDAGEEAQDHAPAAEPSLPPKSPF